MYHYAGNNPIRYTDPDGRVCVAAIGIAYVAVFLLYYDYYCAYSQTDVYKQNSQYLSTAVARSLDNAKSNLSAIFASLSKSIAQAKTGRYAKHHAFPMFMGGKKIQELVPMNHADHVQLHRDLRSFLQEFYPGMEPKRDNLGSKIQASFLQNERENAMAQFYIVYAMKYTEAACQFFKDNPHTLSEENLKWVQQNFPEILEEFVIEAVN